MTGADPVTEKHPILLCEDSGYTLKQLSSIIQDNDYEDLGNHATKAMGEIGLFSLVQVCLDSDHPSEGKGGGERCITEGVDSLEGCLGDQA